MITCTIKPNSLCDNCDRVMPYTVNYQFATEQGNKFTEVDLCEDCANALGILKEITVEGKPHRYYKDDFEEVKDER